MAPNSWRSASTPGVSNVTTTEYYPQTDGKVERFNSMIVLRLRHYVSDHQTDWYSYLLPLTFAYNVQVDRSNKLSLFSLVLTRTPPELATFVSKRPSLASDDDAASLLYARLELI